MKFTIRAATFETNSSSTHSLVFCTPEQYRNFQDGELLYVKYPYGELQEKSFATEQEVREAIKQRIANGEENNNETEDQIFIRLVNWGDICRHCDFGDYLEFFMETWTTPGGEEIVVFGEYGHD